jgi:hypothetical protein
LVKEPLLLRTHAPVNHFTCQAPEDIGHDVVVGYSLVANVSNANRITVKQTGGEAETMYYIISN